MPGSTRRNGIVVGVDGSPESEVAVRWAARKAQTSGRPVTLVNVVTPMAVSWPTIMLQDEISAYERDYAEDVLGLCGARRCWPSSVPDPPRRCAARCCSRGRWSTRRCVEGRADGRRRGPRARRSPPRPARSRRRRDRPPGLLPQPSGARDRGLGFIGSNLCRALADLVDVTAVDSLLPDYGGNLFNLRGYEDKVRINIADVRGHGMEYLVRAPVRSVPRAVPGLSATADDGVEREEHAPRLVNRRH